LIPYKLDKVSIGKNYILPNQRIDFTYDEELIQDLLLNNRRNFNIEMIATLIYIVLFFALIVAFVLKD
jgi:ribosome biogenesis protein Nip4